MFESLKGFMDKFSAPESSEYDHEEDVYTEDYQEYDNMPEEEYIHDDYEREEEAPRRISAFSRDREIKENTKNRLNAKRERNEMHSVKMQIIKPTSYDEARDIIMLLKEKQSVVMNFEFVSKEDGRRIIDTVSGGVTALDGRIVKVSNTIFIAAPHNYQIRSEAEGRRNSNYSYR